jgi:hypothetical protein
MTVVGVVRIPCTWKAPWAFLISRNGRSLVRSSKMRGSSSAKPHISHRISSERVWKDMFWSWVVYLQEGYWARINHREVYHSLHCWWSPELGAAMALDELPYFRHFSYSPVREQGNSRLWPSPRDPALSMTRRIFLWEMKSALGERSKAVGRWGKWTLI